MPNVAVCEPVHGGGNCVAVDLAAFDEDRPAHAQQGPEERMAGIFLGRPAGYILAAYDPEDQRQIEVAQVIGSQDVGAFGRQVVKADDLALGEKRRGRVEEPA